MPLHSAIPLRECARRQVTLGVRYEPAPDRALAIGGNALLKEKESGLQEEQLENARETAEMLARVVAAGYSLCGCMGTVPRWAT